MYIPNKIVSLQEGVEIELGFYSEKQLDQIVPISRSTRWRMRKRGEFPKPAKISPGLNGTPKEIIHQWIAERMGVDTHAAA